MGSRRQSSLSPIHRLLSARDDLRHLFSYIALAGGPANASRDVIGQLRDVTAQLDMEFESEELKSAIEFYAVEQSANNASCNRYGNIWAFDRTALRASDSSSNRPQDAGRYLNANIVADGKGNWWVASQAPIPSTFNTYFTAILNRSATKRHDHLFPTPDGSLKEQPSTSDKAAIIIQLTGWFDGRVVKADNYLPKSEKSVMYESGDGTSSPITLGLLDATVNNQSTHSKLMLKGSQGDSMTIHHFLFHAWPDHGVPETEEDVDALKSLLRTTSKLQQEEECEVYVNCSAGIGRTGTFIALWSLLASPMRFMRPVAPVQTPSAIKPFPTWAQGDKVAKTVDMLREQRGMMCQTTGQIDFIYRLTGITPAQP